MAQFVGVLAPGAQATMFREAETMFDKDAVRVKGALENEIASEMLLLLHDHMGRRTVENPDLAHRAERQGLTARIREMETQGYTVIEHAISPQFADEVRAATLRALLPHQSFSMVDALSRAQFEALIQNPLLMTLVDASLGRRAVIASFSSIRKGPARVSSPCTRTMPMCRTIPRFAATGVGVWALEDWQRVGPTWIVPGSHGCVARRVRP
jgi:hypothetical protein